MSTFQQGALDVWHSIDIGLDIRKYRTLPPNLFLCRSFRCGLAVISLQMQHEYNFLTWTLCSEITNSRSVSLIVKLCSQVVYGNLCNNV